MKRQRILEIIVVILAPFLFLSSSLGCAMLSPSFVEEQCATALATAYQKDPNVHVSFSPYNNEEFLGNGYYTQYAQSCNGVMSVNNFRAVSVYNYQREEDIFIQELPSLGSPVFLYSGIHSIHENGGRIFHDMYPFTLMYERQNTAYQGFSNFCYLSLKQANLLLGKSPETLGDFSEYESLIDKPIHLSLSVEEYSWKVINVLLADSFFYGKFESAFDNFLFCYISLPFPKTEITVCNFFSDNVVQNMQNITKIASLDRAKGTFSASEGLFENGPLLEGLLNNGVSNGSFREFLFWVISCALFFMDVAFTAIVCKRRYCLIRPLAVYLPIFLAAGGIAFALAFGLYSFSGNLLFFSFRGLLLCSFLLLLPSLVWSMFAFVRRAGK